MLVATAPSATPFSSQLLISSHSQSISFFLFIALLSIFNSLFYKIYTHTKYAWSLQPSEFSSQTELLYPIQKFNRFRAEIYQKFLSGELVSSIQSIITYLDITC